MSRLGRLATVGIGATLLLSSTVGVAWASWSVHSTAGGNGAAAAATVEPGPTPSAVADGASVSLSWPVSTLSSGVAVTGYRVARYDAQTLTAQSVSAGCAGTITARSCSEDGLPEGTWVYTITPVIGTHWSGPAGPASAPVATSAGGPPLGGTRSYSVLAATGVANTGPTTITGDLGVDPSPSASITGFPPGTVAGTVNAANPAAAAAQADLSAAYDDAAARAPDGQFAGDQNGQTFTPGVYHTGAAFALTGTLTLDGGGNPNALFVFQVGAALNTAADSHIVLINGAQPANVFWQVLGAVTTGATSSFAGTILAAGAITLGAGTQLIGRALSQGTVTLAGNDIRFSAAAAPTIAIDGGAALESKDTTPAISGTTDAAVGSTVTVTVAGRQLTGLVNSDGTWHVTPTVALSAGDYAVEAQVRDAAGNAGAAQQTLTIEVNPAAVTLGRAVTYSVLAGTNVVGTGTTALSADLGVSPGTAITGFPPGTVGGTVHAGDPQAAAAEADLATAQGDAAGRTPSSEFSGDQTGRTYHEGIHHTATAFALTGTLTLDAQGDPNAVFIIQVGAALNTAASSHVVLANGAQAANVFWQVTGATNTGASSTFVGTIMSAGAITLGDGTVLDGRALGNGVVTLANDTIHT